MRAVEKRARSPLSLRVCVRARDKCVTPPTQARDPITGGDDDGCSTTTATLLIEMRAQTVVALALAESLLLYTKVASCWGRFGLGSGGSEVGHDTMTRQSADGGAFY